MYCEPLPFIREEQYDNVNWLEPMENREYICVDTEEKLDEMCDYLARFDEIAFDTECTGLDWYMNDQVVNGEVLPGWRLVGISFAAERHKSYYVPLGHVLPQCDMWAELPVQLSRDYVLNRLDFIWKTKKLIAHNMKFDMEVMQACGCPVYHPYYCTMMALYCIDNRRELKLKINAMYILARRATKFKEVVTEGHNPSPYPIKDVGPYATGDALNTLELYFYTKQRLLDFPEVNSLFWNIEMPCLPTIAEMEIAGINLDIQKITELGKKLTRIASEKKAQLKELLTHVHYEEMPGREGEIVTPQNFNPAVHKHVEEVCTQWFDFKLPPGRGASRKDALGRPIEKVPATDEKALKKVLRDVKAGRCQKNHQYADKFLNLMLEWREVDKLRGTYTDNIRHKLVSRDGRLHASFLQHGTNTGRLSGKNPNLMNLPKRKDEYDIRSIMVPGNPDWCFVSADYMAVEMRIAAFLSADPDLMAIILGKKKLGELGDYEGVESVRKDKDGKSIILHNDDPIDIHIYTVFKIDNIPYNKIDDEMRSKYKPVGFGILYGITEVGLADQLKCSEKEARAAIEGWLNTFPGVRGYIEGCKKFIAEHGYIPTVFGRRRYVDAVGLEPLPIVKGVDVFNSPRKLKPYAELEKQGVFRALVNARIQGTAADVMKMAMTRIRRMLTQEGIIANIIVQIHDEIVVRCKKADMKRVADIVLKGMYTELRNDQTGVTIPLVGEVKAGDTLSKSAEDLLKDYTPWEPSMAA